MVLAVDVDCLRKEIDRLRVRPGRESSVALGLRGGRGGVGGISTSSSSSSTEEPPPDQLAHAAVLLAPGITQTDQRAACCTAARALRRESTAHRTLSSSAMLLVRRGTSDRGASRSCWARAHKQRATVNVRTIGCGCHLVWPAVPLLRS
eukprot:155396-Chlamydomonas_euryale.AAC.5